MFDNLYHLDQDWLADEPQADTESQTDTDWTASLLDHCPAIREACERIEREVSL